MKLLLIDRDLTELSGIRWFLHTYFPGDLSIEMCTTISEVPQKAFNNLYQKLFC